jgi:hypothetical protein
MPVFLAILFGISAWAQDAAVGSKACAGCHPDIFRSYMATGMARSSGHVGSGNFAEKFSATPVTGKASGATFRVTREKDSYRMSFSRPAVGITGTRDLKWFIGSGNVGRSYVFAVDGFLFQAPVSYYSSVGHWDLSPGYAGKLNIELAKPIEEPCLYCHASRPQPVAQTQNRYLDPPFLEDGVGCERCHGSGQKHATTHRDIVNPAKLDAARRDSICQQCHLTGAARVPRPGRGVGTYRPGDLLSDHVTVLVWEPAGGERAATDHSEQLARSKCKLASGDRLWCGTCHNPHSKPAAPERINFYRQSCLTCHAEKGCALDVKARAAAGDDCASCHMPKARSREGEHVAYTDHTILRRPLIQAGDRRGRKLRAFWASPVEERDLAIAYSSLGAASLPLLEKFHSSGDVPVLVQLAQAYDALGKADLAESLYKRVLRLDPSNTAAEANLAIYLARNGNSSEAIALWQDVFRRNPALASAGINLVIAQIGAGDRAGAGRTLQQVLRFHPDLEMARQLLPQVR